MVTDSQAATLWTVVTPSFGP